MKKTLRQRMIDDMDLAGLSVRSRETYLHAVDRLVTQTWKGIEELTEDEVRAYFLNLRDKGAAKGTFNTNRHGVKFLYEQTLGCHWPLFGKKRSDRRATIADVICTSEIEGEQLDRADVRSSVAQRLGLRMSP